MWQRVIGSQRASRDGGGFRPDRSVDDDPWYARSDRVVDVVGERLAGRFPHSWKASLKVGLEIGETEAKPLADPDRAKVTPADELVDRRSRDAEHRGGVIDREQPREGLSGADL
jgi:hypothetical protein